MAITFEFKWPNDKLDLTAELDSICRNNYRSFLKSLYDADRQVEKSNTSKEKQE